MDIRGDIVKQLRNDKAWTQAQLAEICDVNLRTIQRVENQGSASLETIMALCVAFDVKRQTLFKVPEIEEVSTPNNIPVKTFVLIFIGGLSLGIAGTLVPILLF